MVRQRFLLAVAASAAVILSAPFVQQAFSAVSAAAGPQFRAIGIGATALPVGMALLVAVLRIRDRRATAFDLAQDAPSISRGARYLALASSLGIGLIYILIDSLSFAEAFHFVEYGLLAWLFYRALGPGDDGSVILLPLLAGVIVGAVDEWFQWFIPIRAGEARDVILNAAASGCGLLFAVSVEPPNRLTLALRRESAGRLRRWAATAAVAFTLFFLSAHIGHDIRDREIGVFRSRYTAADLASLGRDRTARWRMQPPVALRRLSREDQYLTEGLWHVQRRNQAWNDGDVAVAWRENRILETFYTPVLETPTYADPMGHRWSADLRDDAARRPGVDRGPSVSDAYPYPLYVWPDLF